MKYQLEQISEDKTSQLYNIITTDLPEYFGLPDCNEHYAIGVKTRINFAIKIEDTYVALLSLDFTSPTPPIAISIGWVVSLNVT